MSHKQEKPLQVFLNPAMIRSDLLYRCEHSRFLWKMHLRKGKRTASAVVQGREKPVPLTLHPSPAHCVPEKSNCQAVPWRFTLPLLMLTLGLAFPSPFLINSSLFKKQSRHLSRRKSSMITREAKLLVCLPQPSGISFALESPNYVAIMCFTDRHPLDGEPQRAKQHLL